MREFHVYKHKNCIDMAILPHVITFIPHLGAYKIKVEYIWVASMPYVSSGIEEEIIIKFEDLKNWELLE